MAIPTRGKLKRLALHVVGRIAYYRAIGRPESADVQTTRLMAVCTALASWSVGVGISANDWFRAYMEA